MSESPVNEKAPAVEIDRQVGELKENLAEWKSLVLGCSRLMLWEKPHEAAILVALPTLFFTLIYFLDAGMMTILTLGGLAFVFLDLGLPHLISYLNLGRSATPEDDDVIFERFCHRLVTYRVHVQSFFGALRKFRTERPPVFYAVISVLLASLAWIGACINGVCIAYFLTMVFVLYPGICKHRLIENGIVHAVEFSKTLIAKVKSSAAGAAAAANKKKK